MKQLSVMVVDDSLIITKKLTQIFENLGHKVVETARNGKEAIDKFKSNQVDLVSMDITMPDMNGIDATKEIFAINPNTIIVMITSHGQEQMVISAIEAGAKGYILKPFDEQKIKDSLEQIIANT